MVCSLPDHEYFHHISGVEGRGLDSHVSEITLYWTYVSNANNSLSGGALMVVIGVIYLKFEKRILTKSGLPTDSAAPADNVLSRALVGMQVRIVLKRPNTAF